MLQAMLETVAELAASTKGILVADESSGTIEKRFKGVGAASTEEIRRGYRELLFTAPGLSDHISGVILFEETLKQNSAAGVPLPQVLSAQAIAPGNATVVERIFSENEYTSRLTRRGELPRCEPTLIPTPASKA